MTVIDSRKRADQANPLQVGQTLTIINGKWPLLIIYLLRNTPLRYRKLLLMLPGISEKVLIGELKKLQEFGVVERKVYPKGPRWVEYNLTPKGQLVLPLIAHLQELEQSLAIS